MMSRLSLIGNLTSLLSVLTRSHHFWRFWRPLAMSGTSGCIRGSQTWSFDTWLEKLFFFVNVRRSSCLSEPDLLASTYTLKPEPFSQSYSCWTLPLSRSPTVRLLFHFVPSHFCHCSTSLSFSLSAALRNQIFCIYFIEIYFWLPPSHLSLRFHFHLGCF